jgi:hypothetical protein
MANDFSVDVDIFDDDSDNTFIDFTVEPITEIALAGMGSLTKFAPKLPTDSLSDKISNAVDKHCGQLIKDINDTTRDRINNAIQQSLDAGLTQEEASSVINDIIDDPMRAERIALNESVKAYSQGRSDFANEAGATGKVWHTQSGNPCEDCQSCEDEGEIGFDDDFGPGWSGPEDSHIGCLCYTSFVFPSGEEE